MKKPMIDTMQRPKFDNLYTPYEAIALFLPFLDDYRARLGRMPVVWEPCDPGNSVITRVLLDAGYMVISSDIRTTGIDFLKTATPDPEFDFDLIVTNPPYSLKNAFLKRAYGLQKPFAYLLPLTALEGGVRSVLFREHGVSLVVPSHRFDFTGKGNAWFATGWFSWGILPENSNQLIFVDADILL